MKIGKRRKAERMPMGKLTKKNLPWIYLFILPSFAVFLLFYLWPIVSAIATSFTRWNGFTSPEWNNFANYLRLFRQESFWIAIGNLLAWSLIAGNGACRLCRAGCPRFLPPSAGLEICARGLHGAERDLHGGMGHDLPVCVQQRFRPPERHYPGFVLALTSIGSFSRRRPSGPSPLPGCFTLWSARWWYWPI